MTVYMISCLPIKEYKNRFISFINEEVGHGRIKLFKITELVKLHSRHRQLRSLLSPLNLYLLLLSLSIQTPQIRKVSLERLSLKMTAQ